VIHDYVHISVGAHVCGSVEIGEGTWIVAGSTISNNVIICPGCVIGAGAVVVKDIDIPGTYIGVPARRKG
jgi:acetyltransferase-like isoleucine patch superfamily enzyme